MSFKLPHYMTSGSTLSLDDGRHLAFNIVEKNDVTPTVITEAIDRKWLRFDADPHNPAPGEVVIFTNRIVTVLFDANAATETFSEAHSALNASRHLTASELLAQRVKPQHDTKRYIETLRGWYNDEWFSATLSVSLLDKDKTIIGEKRLMAVHVFEEGDNARAKEDQERMAGYLLEEEQRL